MGKIFDYIKNEIQKSTGEKERRDNVQRLKDLAKQYKKKVGEAIKTLNEAIESFNERVLHLNEIRKSGTKDDIVLLERTLTRYGRCKCSQEFAPEDIKNYTQFPQREYDKIDDYIGEVDLSSDRVFLETLFRTPVGEKIANRKTNLSMREKANELEVQIQNTVYELKNRKFITDQEKRICEQYISNVKFISKIIREKVLPELQLVDAFLEAEQLKNSILAKREIGGGGFYYYIRGFIGTPYEEHYQFIKNAYMFYIISCVIYDTPVLTNLLKHASTEEDENRLKSERRVLDFQANKVLQTRSCWQEEAH